MNTGGVVAPLAIIAACVVVSAVAVVVARRRGAAADDGGDETPTGPRPGGEAASEQAPPDETAGDGTAGDGTADDDWGAVPADLLGWQASQGHHVDRWLDAHESTLPALVPGADPEIDAEVDAAMAAAADTCPNPEVTALLHAMRYTARAARRAITGGDKDAATAAHTAYARHRSEAISTMSQASTPPAADAP